jgi:NAD(P)-dependent dehydrogenase (short-subunit alcohol dehydrogenase family)
MHSPAGSLSASGHEMQFATNVLGPQVFTQAVLPAVKAAAKAKGEARIIWIASFASQAAKKEGIRFEGLHEGTNPEGDRTLMGSWQYGQSKLVRGRPLFQPNMA